MAVRFTAKVKNLVKNGGMLPSVSAEVRAKSLAAVTPVTLEFMIRSIKKDNAAQLEARQERIIETMQESGSDLSCLHPDILEAIETREKELGVFGDARENLMDIAASDLDAEIIKRRHEFNDLKANAEPKAIISDAREQSEYLVSNQHYSVLDSFKYGLADKGKAWFVKDQEQQITQKTRKIEDSLQPIKDKFEAENALYRTQRADAANDIIYLVARKHNEDITSGTKNGKLIDLNNPLDIKHALRQAKDLGLDITPYLSRTADDLRYFNYTSAAQVDIENIPKNVFDKAKHEDSDAKYLDVRYEKQRQNVEERISNNTSVVTLGKNARNLGSVGLSAATNLTYLAITPAIHAIKSFKKSFVSGAAALGLVWAGAGQLEEAAETKRSNEEEGRILQDEHSILEGFAQPLKSSAIFGPKIVSNSLYLLSDETKGDVGNAIKEKIGIETKQEYISPEVRDWAEDIRGEKAPQIPVPATELQSLQDWSDQIRQSAEK